MIQADASQILFGSKVALRSCGHLFLRVNRPDTTITVTGIHPILHYDDSEKNEEFCLYNATNRDYKGVLTFGSSVTLVTAQGECLAFNASGELRVESIETAPTSKLAKWTLLDPKSTASRRQIACFDEVIFKTPFGELSRDENDTVNCRGRGGDECRWKIVKANVPSLPDWMFTRVHLNCNELVLARNPQIESATRPISMRRRTIPDEGKNLGNLPLAMQEQCLLEDLLYCMCSIEGTYVRRKQEQVLGSVKRFTYAVEPYYESPTADNSLLSLAEKMVPLCNFHDRVSIFMSVHSHFDFGMVSHALCEGISALLKEYRVRLTQLDAEFTQGALTLHKLWYYIQPSLRTMESLHKLASEAEGLKGGALLNAVYTCMVGISDQKQKELFAYLLEKASLPYIDMLTKWIYYGIIEDPYEEFLIRERKDVLKEKINREYNDSYWEQRFVFREAQIPIFLQKLTVKVLYTGKYLNVIRECKKPINNPHAHELDPKLNPRLLSGVSNQRDFIEPIEKAYSWAAQRLIEQVMVEEQLVLRLKSIKHYFFLDTGDFFVHLLDSIQDELEKKHMNIARERLESLLELSLRTSSANADPFKDDVSCAIQPYALREQIYAMQSATGDPSVFTGEQDTSPIYKHHAYKGVETFVLDYEVKWPLTLILSLKSMTKYQIIFRHLFICKYAERQLGQTWLLQQSLKELNLRAVFASSYSLRQRMLNFIKSYIYYLTYEVLERQWQRLEAELKKAETIDEIMRKHAAFQDQCLKESLLLDQELFNVLHKLIWCCVSYSEMMQIHTKSMKFDEGFLSGFGEEGQGRSPLERRRQRVESESASTSTILEGKQFGVMIEKFTTKFDQLFQSFLDIINHS